jgi:1,4-dihydroxy-2-naphthoate octaprenyltransferase
MDLRLEPQLDSRGIAQSTAQRLLRVVTVIRYRFFLYAGLMPYLLGAAWAYGVEARFDAAVFWSGLAGVALAVVGVESFNEYFDARLGTDRVFNPEDLPVISDSVFWLGVVAFAGALAVGLFLTYRGGWPILAFAMLGGLAAIFYVAPPIRWAYRGLGETVIGLSYGPFMVSGSLYAQTGHLSWSALWASLVPGLLIMALAVVNNIPDFHQDRLVGKRTLVVRLGRKSAVKLYVGLAGLSITIAVSGSIFGLFPPACLVTLLGATWLMKSATIARTTYANPRHFVAAVRNIVTCYLVSVGLFTLGCVSHAFF